MVQFQKLTRNLFLTLHGHNLHRQQQQLSKTHALPAEFASHAYCGAAGPGSNMASQQEKALCVLRFEVFRSVITVQREFRALYIYIYTSVCVGVSVCVHVCVCVCVCVILVDIQLQ